MDPNKPQELQETSPETPAPANGASAPSPEEQGVSQSPQSSVPNDQAPAEQAAVPQADISSTQQAAEASPDPSANITPQANAPAPNIPPETQPQPAPPNPMGNVSGQPAAVPQTDYYAAGAKPGLTIGVLSIIFGILIGPVGVILGIIGAIKGFGKGNKVLGSLSIAGILLGLIVTGLIIYSLNFAHSAIYEDFKTVSHTTSDGDKYSIEVPVQMEESLVEGLDVYYQHKINDGMLPSEVMVLHDSNNKDMEEALEIIKSTGFKNRIESTMQSTGTFSSYEMTAFTEWDNSNLKDVLISDITYTQMVNNKNLKGKGQMLAVVRSQKVYYILTGAEEEVWSLNDKFGVWGKMLGSFEVSANGD